MTSVKPTLDIVQPFAVQTPHIARAVHTWLNAALSSLDWGSVMRNTRKIVAVLSLTLVFAGQAGAASLVDAEDQAIIAAASCEEIIEEHHNFSAAEKELADQIRQADNSTVAGNVIGAATLATFGLGFFSWDDQADAKGNLAELTAYREAIAAEGKKKSCKL